MKELYFLSDPDSDYYLFIRRITDNSPSDGKKENIVEVYCTDTDFYPSAGIDILFKTTGNAIFRQNQQSSYHAFTDVYGRIRASLIDLKQETVIVSAELNTGEENNIQARIDFNFIRNQGDFRITHARNISHSFRIGSEPTIAWEGAYFFIDTEGGSGEVEWTVTQSSAEIELSQPDDNKEYCKVTILNRPRQICELQGKDIITKEIVNYRFQILTFVDQDYRTLNIDSSKNKYGRNLLRIDQCASLYDQWGNLRRYPEWNTDRYFWTNDIGFFSTTAINFNNGQTTWLSNSSKTYTVFKLGGY